MRRILLVDDDVSVLFGLCMNLRSRRDTWEAVMAADVDEACELLRQTQCIEILVCDLAMPRGGGIKVLRFAEEKYPRVFRIVLSGMLDAPENRDAVALAHLRLEKPCSADVLRAHLDEVIAQRNQSSPPDATVDH